MGYRGTGAKKNAHMTDFKIAYNEIDRKVCACADQRCAALTSGTKLSLSCHVIVVVFLTLVALF